MVDEADRAFARTTRTPIIATRSFSCFYLRESRTLVFMTLGARCLSLGRVVKARVHVVVSFFLQDIVRQDLVAQFSKDQHGSRLIQQKIQKASPQDQDVRTRRPSHSRRCRISTVARGGFSFRV